jgi:glyoxylase-like metal-dependent hydrolase (beta-lactamase superfamily II)
MAEAELGGDDRRRGFRVDRVSEHLHFVHTEHVNWVVYAGPDGVTLIDSGYVGQRDLLVASLDAIGRRPEEIAAVLITHGHADHLGGAAWLAEQFGTAVHAHADEVANVSRAVMQQAGPPAVLRNAWRPGVTRWAAAIVPLLDRRPGLGVPSVTALPEREGHVAVPGHPRALLIAGHTSGHTAYDFEDEGVLVIGDALVTRHRTSPLVGPQLLPSIFHHDVERARASLVRAGASSARVVLPGHGEAWFGPVDASVQAALEAGSPW